jgi:Arc/MetJ family transcription regulator
MHEGSGLRYPERGSRDILPPGGDEMSTRKTSVEIDQQLLEAVQQALSTVTLRETIEEAFREVLRAEARREEVEALSTMRGMDLADPEVMAGAWRS